MSARASGGGRSDALAGLVREAVLDADLAALVWLLVEATVPVVVAAPAPRAADRVRAALLDLVAPDAGIVVLAGAAESFAWMPEAQELGWHAEQRGSGPPVAASPAPVAVRRPGSTVMVADLEPGPNEPEDTRRGTWGEQALVAIRALSIGYGMLATTRGRRLEDVLSGLAALPVGAMDDELTRLGLVLILAPTDDGLMRVTAAHYLRPVARDAEGHVHRFAPAVLATWDATAGRFEHFSWAITDELAGRIGISTADLEREQARRAGLLAGGAG